MTQKLFRRKFLKQSLTLGSGIALFSRTHPAKAGQKKNTPSNETMKTIMGLRTIHGNFTDQKILDEQLDQILNASIQAARSLGIDSLTTNGIHRGDMERVWEILDLPEENCFPMIAHVLGYPTEEPAVDKGRLDGVGIFHQETYHKLTADDMNAIVARYDDKDAHIALNNNWDEQGHKHYLDWLHTAWLRGRNKPTSDETQMLKILKRSGFVELQKS